MTSLEKFEISNLPQKYRPLGAWKYFGLSLLYSVPVVGFIFLIIHSLSDANINRRSFARSFFCVLIIWLICMLVTFLCGGLSSVIASFSKLY